MNWVLHTCSIVLGNPKESVGYPKVEGINEEERGKRSNLSDEEEGFRMPLHYPRYKKADYENMEEWRLDFLLGQYGMRFIGPLDEKRAYAMGAFLWPDQL